MKRYFLIISAIFTTLATFSAAEKLDLKIYNKMREDVAKNDSNCTSRHEKYMSKIEAIRLIVGNYSGQSTAIVKHMITHEYKNDIPTFFILLACAEQGFDRVLDLDVEKDIRKLTFTRQKKITQEKYSDLFSRNMFFWSININRPAMQNFDTILSSKKTYSY